MVVPAADLGRVSRDAKDVTVLPPSDYAARFTAAMDSYFISVPDKWSRCPDSDGVESDPRLASVL